MGEYWVPMVDVTDPGYSKQLILSDSKDGVERGLSSGHRSEMKQKPCLMSCVDTSGVSEIL